MTADHQSKCEETIRSYVSLYESLSIDNLGDLGSLLSDNVHFIDPFNNVKGRGQVIEILEKMFVDVKDPKFMILDVMWSKETCFMRWNFSCYQSMFGAWSFRGMSELQFDDQGRICAHYDYWDSGTHFFAKLPYIGRIIRAIIRRASIH